jgi:protein-S-isoprenylcysteine O-methyltransferase Ste14
MTDRDIPGVLAPPPVIYAAGLGVAALIQHWTPVPLLPVPWTRPLAIVFAILGLAATAAVLGFRRAGTSPNPWRPSTQLVTGGLYRISRNPMYVGLTLLYLAGACWANSLWSFLLLPIVLLVMLYGVIIREERYLERRFGDPYREYLGRVRRWL